MSAILSAPTVGTEEPDSSDEAPPVHVARGAQSPDSGTGRRYARRLTCVEQQLSHPVLILGEASSRGGSRWHVRICC